MRTRRHALGQNFLHHKPTITKIITAVTDDLARLQAQGTTVRALLEVGPGKLALTRELATLAQARSVSLVLVERDRYLEEDLRRDAGSARLHFFDAATAKMGELFDELAGEGFTPAYFVSNLPYSAASQILAQLCYQSGRLAGATIMVQKEMATRMVAGAGDKERGAFSLLIQSYFEVEHLFDVGPGAFTPPPKVMSAVLRLVPLARPVVADLPSPLDFERFCKKLFGQRRKMIRNSIDKARHDCFPKLGISGTERPEALELTTILELYRLSEGE